jgi:hypothetical protein
LQLLRILKNEGATHSIKIKKHKFTEAEQFVFFFQQSAQLFYKSLQTISNSFRRQKSTEANKYSYEVTLYLGTLV